jgi:hypothetical protein
MGAAKPPASAISATSQPDPPSAAPGPFTAACLDQPRSPAREPDVLAAPVLSSLAVELDGVAEVLAFVPDDVAAELEPY